jgi:hypothetical protein
MKHCVNLVMLGSPTVFVMNGVAGFALTRISLLLLTHRMHRCLHTQKMNACRASLFARGSHRIKDDAVRRRAESWSDRSRRRGDRADMPCTNARKRFKRVCATRVRNVCSRWSTHGCGCVIGDA